MSNTVKALAFVVVILALSAGSYYALEIKGNAGAKLSGDANTGTLNLFVSDAPSNNVSAVYMTFSIISLYENFKGWVNYSIGQETMNILHITASNAHLLENLSVIPQQYTAIGIHLTKVVAEVNGLNETFTLASNDAFISHTFSVVTNRTTNVNIEFNLGSDLNVNTRVFTPNVGSTFYTGLPGINDNGVLNLSVYDAPVTNISAVYITFSNLSLHGVQTGWTNYSTSNKTIDILNVTSANASLLDSLSLSYQEYTMIRLYIHNITVTTDGTNVSFRMGAPFAFVNLPFNVTTSKTTNVALQFNLTSDLNLHARIFTPNVGTTITS